MDRAPNEGSQWFGGSPHLFHRRNNHNFTFVVTWNEAEGKFVVSCHDLSVQRSSCGSIEEMEVSPPARPSLTVEAITEAIAEAVAGAIASAVAADTGSCHDAYGGLAMVPPAAQASGPTQSAHPRGDAPFRTRAEEGLLRGATARSQTLSPASKIAELRNGCSATFSNDVPMLDDSDVNNDREMSDFEFLEILHDDEKATATIIRLSRADDYEDEDDEHHHQHQHQHYHYHDNDDHDDENDDLELCLDLELELEFDLDLETEALEDAPLPLVLTVPSDTEQAATEARRQSSWTRLFSFEDLRAAHGRLSAVSSELEPCLPAFPDEPTSDPARSQRNLDHLCSQLQVYLNYALETCGWQILCEVLFQQAADPDEESETSAPPDDLLLRNLLRDRSIVYVMRPSQSPCCDDDPDSKKEPGSGGDSCAGPSGRGGGRF